MYSFFKSALNEQAEEWGTHTKLLSTKGKGIRQTVPKGFSYFNVEWDGGGFAQIIETNDFPKDFGIDTIAGMCVCVCVKMLLFFCRLLSLLHF